MDGLKHSFRPANKQKVVALQLLLVKNLSVASDRKSNTNKFQQREYTGSDTEMTRDMAASGTA